MLLQCHEVVALICKSWSLGMRASVTTSGSVVGAIIKTNRNSMKQHCIVLVVPECSKGASFLREEISLEADSTKARIFPGLRHRPCRVVGMLPQSAERVCLKSSESRANQAVETLLDDEILMEY